MIADRGDLRFYVRADLASQGLGEWKPHFRISRRIAYFQWLLRRTEYFENCRPDPIGRLFHLVLRLRLRALGERLGFDIPCNVFGPGLAIVHKGTIVVYEDARVGRNCRIHHDVTIGRAQGRCAAIGDDVWIAAGAKIIGGVVVGDRAAIGANAVVVKDVPAGCTVAGVPARVISEHGSAGLITDGYAAASATRS
jgi:serine O-acetyltransferase